MRIIKSSEASSITGLSKSSIFRLDEQGLFPKRVQLSPARVGWVESEIQQWIKERIQTRDLIHNKEKFFDNQLQE